MVNLRAASIFLFAAAVAGCGGGSTSLVPSHSGTAPTATPTGKATPTATPSMTPSPTPSPSSSGSLSPAAVATALSNVETYYQTLPHANLSTDLHALAAEMVSSHQFATANVLPGSISATLPNGATAVIFADRIEDFKSSSDATAQRSPTASRSRFALGAPGGSTSHEIAFLVNSSDSAAFNANLYGDFAGSFTNLGFTQAAGYQPEAIDATLDNIAALGTSHPLDLLDIETHGALAGVLASPYYAMESSTPYSATDTVTPVKYASDIRAGNVFYSEYLTLQGGTQVLSTWGFTMKFIAEHAAFNPGALVYNGSCYGGNQQIVGSVETALKSSSPNPAGRYLAWTKAVAAGDDSNSLAFLLDRALGEQNPSVTYFSEGVTPAGHTQRPFPLDDVQGAMQNETRTGSFKNTTPGLYSQSTPGSPLNLIAQPTGNPVAMLVFDDLGAESLSNDPLFYRMPSIETMQVDESASSGNLRIMGSFPYEPGGVRITDSSGAHALIPTNWTSTEVDVPIPDTGAASAGAVQVLQSQDPNAIGGNMAPLTSWDAALTSTENDVISDIDSFRGTGQGTIVNQYTITFRSDVHPTIPSVDASPVPQNLYFSNVEGQSVASFTTYQGSFQSTNDKVAGPNNDQPLEVDFTLSDSAPVMDWGQRPLAPPAFGMAPLTGQPTGTCNNGLAGPQPGLTNVFCPGLGYASSGVSVCSDNYDGGACDGNVSPASDFGGGGPDGLLIFTMDPATYAISVSSQPANIDAKHFASPDAMASGSVSGSVSGPSYAPNAMTTAAKRGFAPRLQPVRSATPAQLPHPHRLR